MGVAESAPERGGRAAAGVAERGARVEPRERAGAVHGAVALEAESGAVGGAEDDGAFGEAVAAGVREVVHDDAGARAR